MTFILHSKQEGFLREIDEEGTCYWTKDRSQARVFGMMYEIALMYNAFGKSNFPEDLSAEYLKIETKH